MGFTKEVAEKALYLTGGDELDKATDWIDKHCEDPDFNEEYLIPPGGGDTEMKDETQQEAAAPQGQSISSLVNQNEVNSLMEMGYSKNVAEKALFMNQNKGAIDSALEWIMAHMEDPDFEEPLMIVG